MHATEMDHNTIIWPRVVFFGLNKRLNIPYLQGYYQLKLWYTVIHDDQTVVTYTSTFLHVC